MVSPRQKKSSGETDSGEMLAMEHLRHYMTENKPVRSFAISAISNYQADIISVLKGNRNYYVSPCQCTGIWLCSNKPTLFRH